MKERLIRTMPLSLVILAPFDKNLAKSYSLAPCLLKQRVMGILSSLLAVSASPLA